ncbi:2-octaprenyl-6-methoxyphenol hydroxylase [Prochlorococcus sp. MIT 1306]|nr:2-octaprenyl-6-methoxyphenol hydroxylase [Prochlorococcus sp. MIT 1306]
MRVKILGAGPTGSLLALALARLGNSVTLCDPLTVEELPARSRAYALTHSSRRLLQSLDLWASLIPHLAPFTRLRLDDQELNRHTYFEVDDLSSQNQLHGAVGWILDHRPLMELLIDRLQTSPKVLLNLGRCDDHHLDGHDLVVAADGPRSLTRQAWGINTWNHPYQNGCLTAKVLLRGADPLMAYELFRAEGPLAVLPMGGEVFQMVWSAPLRRCQERAGLSPSCFLDHLAAVLPDGLQPDVLLDRPAAFPLQLAFAFRLQRGRGVLVGESGHRCHPVGGQGLNLCWRDVSTLMNVVKNVDEGKLPVEKLPQVYARQRIFDLVLVGLFTDLIVRFFSSRNILLLMVRLPLMFLLARLSLLRQLLLKAMTDGPITVIRLLPE